MNEKAGAQSPAFSLCAAAGNADQSAHLIVLVPERDGKSGYAEPD
jgi:hypothetical protein